VTDELSFHDQVNATCQTCGCDLICEPVSSDGIGSGAQPRYRFCCPHCGMSPAERRQKLMDFAMLVLALDVTKHPIFWNAVNHERAPYIQEGMGKELARMAGELWPVRKVTR
jgi:hypothetical protein